MNTFWRIALAWMLALALPLQGHAAQRLLACAAAPVPAMAAVLASPQVGAALSDAHHAQPGHGAHGGAHPGHDAEADAPPSAAADHSPQADRCSACASCCHAAALPPSLLQLDSVQPALTETPFAPPALPRVWPEGLERPPRAIQR